MSKPATRSKRKARKARHKAKMRKLERKRQSMTNRRLVAQEQSLGATMDPNEKVLNNTPTEAPQLASGANEVITESAENNAEGNAEGLEEPQELQSLGENIGDFSDAIETEEEHAASESTTQIGGQAMSEPSDEPAVQASPAEDVQAINEPVDDSQ